MLKNSCTLLLRFSCVMSFCVFSACQMQGLSGAVPMSMQRQDIVPTTKGSSLGITPSTKGGTYLLNLALEAPLKGAFDIQLKQEDQVLAQRIHSTEISSMIAFSGLNLNPEKPLYIEARSLTRPSMVLMFEDLIRAPERTLQLNVETTAAVYLAQYLNATSVSPALLLQSSESLQPIVKFLEGFYQESEQAMTDMEPMRPSLEQAKEMYSKRVQVNQ